MNIFHAFAADLDAILASLPLTEGLSAEQRARVTVEPPRDASHGDLSTNAAMVLSKEAKTNPRALAEAIVGALNASGRYVKAEVAGPGFINITLKPEIYHQVLRAVLTEGKAFGMSAMGAKAPINIEYVSANPTGPMHVGHGRGAVYGDALANLMDFAGFAVSREYYINDAGSQVDVLARSAFHRYREALGRDLGPVAEGLYPGDYLIPVGKMLAETHGEALEALPESDWLPIVRSAAVDSMMSMICEDLEEIGVKHNIFYSEKSLDSDSVPVYTNNSDGNDKLNYYLSENIYSYTTTPNFLYKIGQKLRDVAGFSSEQIEKIYPNSIFSVKSTANMLADFTARNLIYQGRLPPPKGQRDEDWEDREQALFRATDFGDDVDRPLLKADGGYTYFASDIAYHASKFERGFPLMIDVWGADHGGYVKRLQAAVKAATAGKGALEVRLCQLVKLMRNGEPVKMSKRSGDFVTLREVIDEVGRDAIRFMMLDRKNDAELEFDLAKVIEQSKENPVFYVQYAHARCASVFRQAKAGFEATPISEAELANVSLESLNDEAQIALLRLLASYPRLIEQAALSREPHRIAFYLGDLASSFHGLWNKGKDLPDLRFINLDNRKGTMAGLALVKAVMTVIASGLAILGVSAPDEMR